MKKMGFLLLFFSLCMGSYAQNSTLPDAVSMAFSEKFPKAKKVKWTPEDVNEYAAYFVNDSINASALYETDGKWIHTLTEVNITKLPPTLLLAIKEKFPKSKINHAFKVEHHKKGQYYELEMKTKETLETFYFDGDGKEVR